MSIASARFVLLSLFVSLPAFANNSLHTTWLWHLHQPIYWPDRRSYGTDHYEAAWDTIQQQDARRPHPSPEILRNIFGLDDRINAYQGRPSAALGTVGSYLNSGVQISYSGALMENVQSLGAAGQLGYGSGWYLGNRNARTWTTTGGKPRMDLVNFTYHHALAPLLSDETLAMELRIHQRQMEIFWTTSPALSHGYFPAETCFTERMIPVLKAAGINWSIIANTHLARACADFPVIVGSGGENCDLPNLADQLNPAQGAGNYQRTSIDRGCSPIQVMPFGFQVHYARYVDPETGAESKLILVPSDQVLGWKDSYSQWGLDLLNPLNARNDPAKPSLVMCAHDGDNAWSGGYSYYMEWVKNFCDQASSRGYEPTSVEQFLQEFSPDANDVVHIEDGGWVYADSDFGSPMFINWHWPPSYSANGVNVVDPSLGTSDKADNWRVIIATENRVKTAQQISGITPNIDQVRDPGSFSTTPNAVELGWHYYLASLDSGFVYYGCHDDECQRAAAAQSNAARNVDGILAGNPAADTTPPTLFPPQRHPWNPGGTNFGVQYSYKITVATNSDFWVWTYAYDVSGVTNVSLKFRNDGLNPPTSDQFKTYAGGPLAGAWITANMTKRIVTPVIGVTPQYIADYYYTQITGITNAYVDYYVSAADSRGNTYKSPIQHVWVGSGSGGGGGSGSTGGCVGRACVSPVPPVQGNSVTVLYYPSGGPLASANPIYIHLGWNNWGTVASPDPAMSFNTASNRWEYTATVPSNATELESDFNNGAATWDNNGGAGVDYRFAVSASNVPQVPNQPQNLLAVPVQTNQINLTWSAAAGASAYLVNRSGSPVSLTAGTSYSDTGLTPNTFSCYSVVASNNVGFSTPSATVCTNTLQPPATPLNLAATPVQTNQVNLSWSAVAGAAGYLVSRGASTVALTASASFTDIGLAPKTQYCYSILASNIAGFSAATAAVCATTPALPTNYPPFALDGTFNYPGYLLASSGMVLYSALRGTTLYVATWSPGTNGLNDHFIFVSDQLLPSASAPAPWGKAGYVAVAATKPFLASESANTYISWYTNGNAASLPCFKADTNAGAMAGTIDLVQAFGYLPPNIYLCAAAYITTNSGPVVSQCPAGSGPDNIDPNEFFVIPTAALPDNNADGKFDRLDPALDFRLQSLQSLHAGYAINWAAMPNHTYQVQWASSLSGAWSNLSGTLTTAGPLQLYLSSTDSSPAGTAQRFYKIELLP